MVDFNAIHDSEIAWAEGVLDLQRNAFDICRQNVIKKNQNSIITACPGSGKTTLLVAKLAILSKMWPDSHKGICVLSHTNVARNEIEQRLGKSFEGYKLLNTPHFIGTIDSFVGKYLAIPYLNSIKINVDIVDSDFCKEYRWNKLQYGTRTFLERKHIDKSILCIQNSELSFPGLKCGPDTTTYQDVKNVCDKSIKNGILCFEEMYVYANKMLITHPEVIDILQNRFSYLFVDEAQDNDIKQTTILDMIFRTNTAKTITQFFGDPDQAIFHTNTLPEIESSTFVCDEMSILNSYRFDQRIARLTSNLGNLKGGLIGCGPKKRCENHSSLSNTIFLFTENTINQVIPSFGRILLNSFTDSEITEGRFAAIGNVIRDDADSDKKPYSIKDYWDKYSSKKTIQKKPGTFIEYVRNAQRLIHSDRNVCNSIEIICEAFHRVFKYYRSIRKLPNAKYLHRYILMALSDDEQLLNRYKFFLTSLLIDRVIISETDYNNFKSIIEQIAVLVTGSHDCDNDALTNFIAWEQHGNDPEVSENPGNDYLYTYGTRSVKISLGSIHSVKGETYTAVLVLETFYHQYNLKNLLPYLCGEMPKKTTPTQNMRKKVHYVAMTRPSHLLCLAMRIEDVDDNDRQKLISQGWTITNL